MGSLATVGTVRTQSRSGRLRDTLKTSTESPPPWAGMTRIVFMLVALPVVAPAQVTEPVVPTVFNGDLRDLPVVRGPRPGDPTIEIPRRQYPRPGQDRAPAPRAPGPDPLLDRHFAALPALDRMFTAPTVNFGGQGYSGVNPPGTVGDVGPSHYIQLTDGSGGTLAAICNKADGRDRLRWTRLIQAPARTCSATRSCSTTGWPVAGC